MTTGAREVSGIEQTGRRADVAKLSQDEVHTDNQVANDLPPHSQAEMRRGHAREVSCVNRALFIHFDVGDGKVAIVRVTAKQCEIPRMTGRICNKEAPVKAVGLDKFKQRAGNWVATAAEVRAAADSAPLSVVYCAFIQVSDPASLTATFVKKIRAGLPSAVPRWSVEKSSGPAFL